MNQQPKYRRILLKLSGEALANGQKDSILDFTFIDQVAAVLKKCLAAGVEIGIVVGAGNIWRGATGQVKMQRARADHMGMLATTMNAIALSDAFIRNGMEAAVMSAVEMDTYADHYTSRHADRLLKEGKICIFAGGTGSPYFSTDTGAALRAAEIGADAILMAKNIDYLYTADPRKDPTATPIYDVTYDEILEKNLRAFDMSAVIFCRDNGIESYGFGLADPENIETNFRDYLAGFSGNVQDILSKFDFDNIIIPSMNERIFPRRIRSHSFIPNTLRKGYGMPTTQFQESIFAYYFYRMISRAKKVYMLYDARTGGMRSGDPSRYITQLQYLYKDANLKSLSLKFDISKTANEDLYAEKTEEVMKKLKEYTRADSDKNLSASSLPLQEVCRRTSILRRELGDGLKVFQLSETRHLIQARGFSRC